jgi:hypothetical protein
MPRKGFKSKPKDEVRSVKTLITWTPQEAEQVGKNVKARKTSFNEFVRRAALNRKAPDVDYVTDIVLQLSDITRAVRMFHAALTAEGIQPPEAELLALIREARAAMLRIER